MTIDIQFYTSPFASRENINNLSSSKIQTPTPNSQADILTHQVHGMWIAGNWPEVIDLIEQILVLEPENEVLRQRLYAALVGYGYQLVTQGLTERAQVMFDEALRIRPDGTEALAGVQALIMPTLTPEATVAVIEPTPSPSFTVHTIVRGDTLFSLAQRYGTTVDEIMEINGLSSNTITFGQTLTIPTE